MSLACHRRGLASWAARMAEHISPLFCWCRRSSRAFREGNAHPGRRQRRCHADHDADLHAFTTVDELLLTESRRCPRAHRAGEAAPCWAYPYCRRRFHVAAWSPRAARHSRAATYKQDLVVRRLCKPVALFTGKTNTLEFCRWSADDGQPAAARHP
ncbi:hypothetical protein HBB16_01485 [Pseudonocardia sp. MCCB 268]|nr:hypothetical protein [Pseudonocardia cytotoxica]